MNGRSFFFSALISGIFIGVLANLPVLNLINCFLCIWVWIGALLAVFIYRAFQHGSMDLTPGQGAGLGALSGLIGAFVGVIVYLLTSFISLPTFIDIARQFDVNIDLNIGAGDIGAVLLSSLFFFILDVVGYPIFGALSGLITASIMGQKPKTSTGEIA
jgi:hypothetical protein